jgi:glutathione S-transferase
MITVYAAYNLPFDGKGLVRDLRVMWALEELNMPYAFHWMDASKGEQKLQANRALNPFGQIPSMADGDVKLSESGAIVHYLYDKAGRLPGEPAARAEMLRWMFAALNTVEPTFIDILRWDVFWRDRPGRDVRYPEVIATAKTRLEELSNALGDKAYLAGTFGPADIFMTTILDFAKHQPSVFENAAVIRAYIERCKSRPAYQAAYAKQGGGPGTPIG